MLNAQVERQLVVGKGGGAGFRRIFQVQETGGKGTGVITEPQQDGQQDEQEVVIAVHWAGW